MSAYTGDIVKDGLTLYLDAANYKSFVSGSTTWYDLARPGFTGSLINGPAYTGSNKGAIIFDGSNDYVNLPSSSLVSSSQMTFALWNFGNSLAGTTSVIYFMNSSGTRTLNVHLPWGSVIYFDAGNGSGNTGGAFDRTSKSATTAEFLGWQYWVFTKNATAGTMKIYLNGELWHSAGGANAPIGASVTGSLGSGGPTVGYYYNGRIGMAKLYNRELSAAEIRENYNATKGRYDTTRSSDAIKPRLSTSGLVLHLDAANYRSFVSGSTTWRDLSGFGNNGALTNSPGYSTASNGSIVFDGTDDEVLINNSDSINFIGAQQYTVLVWIYPNLGGVTWHGIVSKGNSQQYALTINSTSAYLHYETNQGGIIHVDSPNNSVSANTWQQVGIRYDGSTKTIWKNGVSIASQAATTLNSSTNTEQLRIGEGNNGEQYRGNIGVVQIYNRALSAAEITQNFNTTKGRYGYVL